jgi:hypothetical protein
MASVAICWLQGLPSLAGSSQPPSVPWPRRSLHEPLWRNRRDLVTSQSNLSCRSWFAQKHAAHRAQGERRRVWAMGRLGWRLRSIGQGKRALTGGAARVKRRHVGWREDDVDTGSPRGCQRGIHRHGQLADTSARSTCRRSQSPSLGVPSPPPGQTVTIFPTATAACTEEGGRVRGGWAIFLQPLQRAQKKAGVFAVAGEGGTATPCCWRSIPDARPGTCVGCAA